KGKGSWVPPEGYVFDDNMGLVSKTQKRERLLRYVTSTYRFYLLAPIIVYFLFLVLQMILSIATGTGERDGTNFDTFVFLVAMFMVLMTNSRIDSLVELLKEDRLLAKTASPEEKSEKPEPPTEG
ncbi:MAG: hypothetical protein ACYTHM_04095, partial [Planctomycetota bacterium]